MLKRRITGDPSIGYLAQIFLGNFLGSFPIENHFIGHWIIGSLKIRPRSCCLANFVIFPKFFFIFWDSV